MLLSLVFVVVLISCHSIPPMRSAHTQKKNIRKIEFMNLWLNIAHIKVLNVVVNHCLYLMVLLEQCNYLTIETY